MKTALSGFMLAVSAAMMAGCHGADVASPAAIQTIQARVVMSRQLEAPVNVRSTGTIHARESAVISAQMTGRIQRVLAREGDSVRAGQALIVLDDAALNSSVAQAQAAAAAANNQQAAAGTEAKLAASTLNRYLRLQAEKSVSPQEMDEVKGRAEAAAARLDAMRAQADAMRAQESGARIMLGYTHLVAPFAGVVTSRMADPGTMAAPGVPLLQVDQAGALQLQTTLDESAIGAIHKGMKVEVSIRGASLNLAGTVAEINASADAASRGFTLKIDLPSSGSLRAGMYGTAEFPNGVRQAIFIPRSAVVMRGSLASAYVLDSQGIAQLRTVTLGATQNNLVEVMSGISSGEKLVDTPGDREIAGKRIEVQP